MDPYLHITPTMQREAVAQPGDFVRPCDRTDAEGRDGCDGGGARLLALPPVVRLLIRRLQADTELLCLRADGVFATAQLDADHARRGIAVGELLKFLLLRRSPLFALVRWIRHHDLPLWLSTWLST